jgi:hypothetical protein
LWLQILSAVVFQDRGRFIVGIRKVKDRREPRILLENGVEMRLRRRKIAKKKKKKRDKKKDVGDLKM